MYLVQHLVLPVLECVKVVADSLHVPHVLQREKVHVRLEEVEEFVPKPNEWEEEQVVPLLTSEPVVEEAKAVVKEEEWEGTEGAGPGTVPVIPPASGKPPTTREDQEGPLEPIPGPPGTSQLCERVLPLLHKLEPRPRSLELGL